MRSTLASLLSSTRKKDGKRGRPPPPPSTPIPPMSPGNSGSPSPVGLSMSVSLPPLRARSDSAPSNPSFDFSSGQRRQTTSGSSSPYSSSTLSPTRYGTLPLRRVNSSNPFRISESFESSSDDEARASSFGHLNSEDITLSVDYIPRTHLSRRYSVKARPQGPISSSSSSDALDLLPPAPQVPPKDLLPMRLSASTTERPLPRQSFASLRARASSVGQTSAAIHVPSSPPPTSPPFVPLPPTPSLPPLTFSLFDPRSRSPSPTPSDERDPSSPLNSPLLKRKLSQKRSMPKLDGVWEGFLKETEEEDIRLSRQFIGEDRDGDRDQPERVSLLASPLSSLVDPTSPTRTGVRSRRGSMRVLPPAPPPPTVPPPAVPPLPSRPLPPPPPPTLGLDLATPPSSPVDSSQYCALPSLSASLLAFSFNNPPVVSTTLLPPFESPKTASAPLPPLESSPFLRADNASDDASIRSRPLSVVSLSLFPTPPPLLRSSSSSELLKSISSCCTSRRPSATSTIATDVECRDDAEEYDTAIWNPRGEDTLADLHSPPMSPMTPSSPNYSRRSSRRSSHSHKSNWTFNYDSSHASSPESSVQSLIAACLDDQDSGAVDIGMALGLEASLREIFETDRMVREDDDDGLDMDFDAEGGVSPRWTTPTPAMDMYDEKYLSSYSVPHSRSHSRAFSDVSALDVELETAMRAPRSTPMLVLSRRPSSQALSTLSTGTIVGPRSDSVGPVSPGGTVLDVTPTPSPRQGGGVEWGYAI